MRRIMETAIGVLVAVWFVCPDIVSVWALAGLIVAYGLVSIAVRAVRNAELHRRLDQSSAKDTSGMAAEILAVCYELIR